MTASDQLTLDEQRRRITHLAQAALSQYALDAPRLTFLSDTDNTVYRVDTSDGTYALRICNPAKYGPEAIQSELSWLAAIRRDTVLVVPEPVPDQDGQRLQTITSEGVPEPRHCVLFYWVEGEFHDQDLTPAMLERVGEAMGTLHRHAEEHVRTQGVHRHRETWKDLRAWARGREDLAHIYSSSDRAILSESATRALTEIEAIEPEHDHGLIHADLHQHNYLFYGDEVRMIDFDDCLFAPFAYDLAITLWYLVGRPAYQALEGALLGGYERVRVLPAGYRAHLPLLMLARTLSMVEWVLGWSSPTLLPWGPQFLRNAPQGVRYYLDRT